MALAEGAHRAQIPFEAACLDHGLRVEAGAEVELVRAWAAERSIPFHTRRLAIAAGGGIEARARLARYEALLEIARGGGLSGVATAHTATDQAETLLMRLARGTAGRGMVGIQSRRSDGVFRPLLFATREDTRRYVEVRGVPFASDPMNDDPSFLRVRVRREVLPLLERVAGPHVVASLARAARYAAEDEAWLGDEARGALARCRVDGGLDRVAVLALGPPIRRRVVAAWLEEQGLPLDAHHLDDALEAIAEQRTATLPNDRVLTVERATLSISAAPPRLHGTSSSDDGRSQE